MYRFLFLLLISYPTFAYTGDTLLLKILSFTNDTERVNRLYKRGFELRTQDPQLSFEYAKQCEQQAKRTGSARHVAKSYNLLGILYYKKGNYNTALMYHRRALGLRSNCGDSAGMAMSYLNLGNVYSDLQLTADAEQCYLNAMSIYERFGLNDGVTKCLVNLGGIKHQLKQYDAAIRNYEMAMKLCAPNDYYTQAIYLTNIGETYVDKGEIEKGLACNADALELRILADNQTETADNYLNLGEIYILKNEAEKARYFIDTAYFIACKTDYFELKYAAMEQYSKYYERVKNFEMALYWLRRYKATGDSVRLAQPGEQTGPEYSGPALTEAAESKTKNNWLLAGVVIGSIFIPFYMIRFKR